MLFDTAYFFAWVLTFIFGTAFQKYCQTFVAQRLGDSTSRSKGRLTLKPAAHHEPLGLLFAFLLSLGYPAIAWGKPLTIDTYRIRGGRLGRSIVALVGPLSYLLLALLIWLASKFYIESPAPKDLLARLLVGIIVVNLILCAFNLIPIPPLDGYDLIRGILPKDWEPRLLWLEQYGILVLVVLVLILPFFLQINILFEFFVIPVTTALGGLLGVGDLVRSFLGSL
ncbi:MAG: site-2 protease family protein [Chloroflexota bacterium]|nr:site-2 protease family protein [Chloroflexota bacterium]